MADLLSDAGARMRAATAGVAPAPVDEVVGRARSRRRRKRAAGAAAGLVAVTGVVAGVVAIAGGRSTTVSVNRPGLLPPSMPAPMIPLDGKTPFYEVHPGEQVVAYGGAEVTVPAGWRVAGPLGCPSADTVQVGETMAACGGPGPWVRLAATTTSEAPNTDLEGTPAVETITGATVTWDVPSLGVELVASGASPQQLRAATAPVDRVVQSLRRSTLSYLQALRSPTQIVAGSQTVTADGVRVTVPDAWQIDSADPGDLCGDGLAPASTVFTYAGATVAFCPAGPPPVPGPVGDGLWLRPDPDPTITGTGFTTAAGVHVVVGTPSSPTATDAPFTATWSDGAVHGVIGLGPDPVVAEEVLSSLRPAG